MVRYTDTIQPEFFEDPAHNTLSQLSKDFYYQYGNVPDKDSLMVRLNFALNKQAKTPTPEEIEVYHRIINFIFDVDIQSNKKFFVDQIVSFAKTQAFRLAILSSIQAYNAGDKDVEKYKREIDNACKVGEDTSQLGSNFFDGFTNRMERREKELEIETIPTLLNNIDRNLKNQGLGKGHVGVILAPTGGGKTHFLNHFSIAACFYGRRVLHITLEQTEDEILDMLDSRIADLSHYNLVDRKQYEHIVNKMKKVQRFGGSIIVKEFPASKLTVNKLKDYMEQLKNHNYYFCTKTKTNQPWTPEILIIDYAENMMASKTYREYRHELGSIFVDLKGLAMEADIPIWTAAQANREAVDKEIITIKNFGESWKAVHPVDIVLAVCQTDEEHNEGKMRIFFAKNRKQRDKFQVNLNINWSTGIITDGDPGIILNSTKKKKKEKEEKIPQHIKTPQRESIKINE